MRKAIFIGILVFFSFAFAVQADTDLTGNGCLIDASNTRFFLSSDFTCDITPTMAQFNNVSVDFQGNTLTGNIIVNNWNFNGLEVYNGNMVGHIALTSNYQANKIYLHDLSINTSDFAFRNSPHTSLAPSIDLITVNNITVVSAGDIFGTTGQILVSNSNLACSGGGAVNTGDNQQSGTASGIQTYLNDVVDGCTGNSYDQNGILPTIIILQNTTFPIDTANLFGQGGNTVVHEEPLYINLKDQNGNNISGSATVVQTAGSSSLLSVNWNPTPDTTLGVVSGNAVGYIAKNITTFGGDSSYPTYNVTVRSRTQSSSSLVTFHSPADENFTLDFTSEDVGGPNVTIVNDTRTTGEKQTNAVMNLYPILIGLLVLFILIGGLVLRKGGKK